MYVNSTGNLTQARQIAQANADYTGVPWVIFTDTSGNLRAERQSTQKNVSEVIQPRHPLVKQPE